MKIKDILFAISSSISFIGLSVTAFVLAKGIYSGDFILIISLATFLMILSLLGAIFPKKIYKLLYKVGAVLLSTSEYYDNMVIDESRGYKPFIITMKCLAALSLILLIVLILLLVL